MQYIVNGQNEEHAADTLLALLQERGNEPAKVVVELNEQIIPKDAYAATALHEGDRLELVQFVGGG